MPVPESEPVIDVVIDVDVAMVEFNAVETEDRIDEILDEADELTDEADALADAADEAIDDETDGGPPPATATRPE